MKDKELRASVESLKTEVSYNYGRQVETRSILFKLLEELGFEYVEEPPREVLRKRKVKK